HISHESIVRKPADYEILLPYEKPPSQVREAPPMSWRAYSPDGKTGMLPNFGRMKAQHDVFAWNPARNELIGYRPRSTVALNPDLAVDDVNMDDRAVHAAHAVPAHVHHLVMIAVTVHDRLGFNLAMRGLIAGILLDHPAHDLPVAFYSIH